MLGRARTLLSLPINDRDALAHQLAADELLATFTAQDFPLVSTQGALEKINAHIAVPNLRPRLPRPQIDRDHIERPEVPVLAEYRRMFTFGCAQVAYEAFQAALHAGVPEPGAYYAGIVAGRRCQVGS